MGGQTDTHRKTAREVTLEIAPFMSALGQCCPTRQEGDTSPKRNQPGRGLGAAAGVKRGAGRGGQSSATPGRRWHRPGNHSTATTRCQALSTLPCQSLQHDTGHKSLGSSLEPCICTSQASCFPGGPSNCPQLTLSLHLLPQGQETAVLQPGPIQVYQPF